MAGPGGRFAPFHVFGDTLKRSDLVLLLPDDEVPTCVLQAEPMQNDLIDADGMLI